MSARTARWWIAILFALCGVSNRMAAAVEPAAEPLHHKIDRIVNEAGLGIASPLTADAEFLRRVHLDLVGTIPSAAEARDFFDDPSPSKRQKLVDELLGDLRYARHMANVVDVFLMERRGAKHVKEEEWQQYLYAACLSNKPWNELAHEILAADGTEKKNRGAAKFYLAREGDPDLITRDIGRVFFGMDLQCCQCHDHPLIDTFYQSDYFGIYAFVNRGFVFADEDKVSFYGEKAEGEVEFTSVFTEEKSATRPRLPGGFQIAEPVFLSGDEYEVKPVGKARPVPRYSRRAQLAELATGSGNTAFSRNIVNRLWCYMMGRGLVHPVDLNHADNPPVHPDLLDVLAREFESSGYDMRKFIRELALSRTYQQSSQALTKLDASPSELTARLAEWKVEYERSVEEQAKDEEAARIARESLATIEESIAALLDEFGKSNSKVRDAQKKSNSAQKKLTEAEGKLAEKQSVAAAVREAAEKIKLAADQLKDEEELIAAAAKFGTRAEQLEKQVVTLAQSVSELRSKADSAAKGLAQARSSTAPIVERLDAKRAQHAQALFPLREASRELNAAVTRVRSAQSGLRIAEQISEQQQLAAKLTATRHRTEQVATELATRTTRFEEANAALPMLEQRLVAAQVARDETDRHLKTTRAEVSKKHARAKLLTDAADKAEVALLRLAKDDELAKTTKQLKTRSDQLQMELSKSVAEIEQLAARVSVARSTVDEARQTLDSARSEVARSRDSMAHLEAELPDLEKRLARDAEASKLAFEKWIELSESHFFAAGLKALSPEQMAWAVLRATGMVDRQYQAARKAVDENLPPSPNFKANRQRAIERHVYRQLKANIDTFVALFGHAAGQPQADFFATVDQALFFANAGSVQSWLEPQGENLAGRLGALSEPAAVADELYLSVLTRYPTSDEVAGVARYLHKHPEDKVATITQMIWGLVASAEFRFNH